MLRNVRTCFAQQIAFTALFGLMLTGCGSKVPDLTGKTRADAEAALAKDKLKVGNVTTAASTGKPAGTVVDQDPKPNAKAPADMTIALVIEGASTTTTTGAGGDTTTTDNTPPSFVTVPSLIGKTLDEAQADLLAASLAQGNPTIVVSDQPAGKIFQQNPSPGKTVAPGTGIDITVATNSNVAVPQVIGQTQAAAEQMLKAAGLTVGQEVSVLVDGGQAVGTVLDANPKPGIPVGNGTPVMLNIKQDAVHVPGVTGWDVKDAQLQAFRSGLQPVVSYDYNVQWPVTEQNKVLRASPAANTLVPRNSDLAMVVKTRNKPIWLGWQRTTLSGKNQVLRVTELTKIRALAPASH